LARKSHTANVATFVSPGHGPIGRVYEGTARFQFARRDRWRVPKDLRPTGGVPEVPLLTMSIGDSATVIDAVAGIAPAGVVLSGFGGGHLPADVATSQGLERMLATGPVVLASRSGSGRPLTSTYSGFSGSETELLGRGVITAGRLDAPRARVLLALLLAGGADTARVRAEFADLNK